MTSETVSKKRGRPLSVSKKEIDRVRLLFPEVKTHRGLQNRAYAQRAVDFFYGYVKNVEEYRPLFPSKESVMSGEEDLPFSVFTELGRLPYHEMEEAARNVCEQKLSRANAVKKLKARRCRHGKPGCAIDLFNTLAKAFDRYCESHDCTTQQAVGAVGSLWEIVSEIDSDGRDTDES